MTEPIVEVLHLSHRYSIDWAIRDINFSINQKGILGLLGSNGAGKSTTMNIICGVLNQTEGDVFINGIDLRKDPVAAKKNIGFLPQKPPLYPDLNVHEYLVHCAGLRRMPKNQVENAVEVAMKRCGITHFRKRLIKNLSGGYQQRVGIAQSIVHNPKFVVLDEPTNGLDPNQILEIRALIKEIGTDHSVLLSTHILSEVQAMCDNILMIENGTMVFEGTMDEFNNYVVPNTFSVIFAQPVDKALFAEINGIVNVEEITNTHFRIRFNGGTDITERMIAESVKRGWHLREISLERSSLDTIFAHLSGKLKNNI